MEYKQATGQIQEIRPGLIKVCIMASSQDECDHCSSCPGCAGQPGGVTHYLRVTEIDGLADGDIVTVERVVPPFALSLFLVFILPLIFLAGLPLLAVWVAQALEWPALGGTGVIVLLGFAGLALAFGINYFIDRAITRRYPPRVQKTE